MTDSLLKTPLHAIHVGFGARMVDFAGWSLPISYRGIRAEHVHTRDACSLFDVSHMGRLRFGGPDAGRFLDRTCTRNLADAQVGRSYYTHMCREDGGILDDMIVSRFEDDWLVVCNASNRAKIIHWIEQQRAGFEIDLTDETTTTAMIALQGPATLDLVQEVTRLDLSALRNYRFTQREVVGTKITIFRSGYTGEDGLEIIAPAGIAAMGVPFLLGSPENPRPVIKPAGLGARDTLRIEAAMPLYGHELGEHIDPLSAGQGWCVDLDKDFIGAAAMREKKRQGLPRKLVGLLVDGKRIARQHHGVYADQTKVGEVTSGTLSPTLKKSIAMAMVDTEHASEGIALRIDLGKTHVDAAVVKLPFYKRAKQ